MVLEQELDYTSRITRGTQRSRLAVSFNLKWFLYLSRPWHFLKSTGLLFYGMSLNCGFSVSL